MATQFVKNLQGTGSYAIFNLKDAMKNASWTVTKSSDGTTVNSSGDQISAAGSGSGGMTNNYAWFVIRMPTANSVTRELCFQRGTNNTSWRIQYSYSGGFSGSGTATAPPSAPSDAQLLYGGGTDASPTFGTIFSTDNTYAFQACVPDTSPYGFWVAAYSLVGRAMTTCIVMDPTGGITQDDDPYVFNVCSGARSLCTSNYNDANTVDMNQDGTANPLRTWLYKNMGTSEGWVNLALLTMSTFSSTTGIVVFPSGLPVNSYTANDDNCPAAYARPARLSAPQGFKGLSTFIQLPGAQRSTGETQGGKSRIILGKVSLPWDGITTPL